MSSISFTIKHSFLQFISYLYLYLKYAIDLSLLLILLDKCNHFYSIQYLPFFLNN